MGPDALPRFQHPLIRPLLCTIVDINFREFLFHDVGGIGQEEKGPRLLERHKTLSPWLIDTAAEEGEGEAEAQEEGRCQQGLSAR